MVLFASESWEITVEFAAKASPKCVSELVSRVLSSLSCLITFAP